AIRFLYAFLMASARFSCSAAINAAKSDCLAGTTWTVTEPISSNDCSPHFTRLGGWLGLWGLSAELSYVIATSMRVPFGSGTGFLYWYWSCQLKSQSLIHSSHCLLPSGSVATACKSLAR